MTEQKNNSVSYCDATGKKIRCPKCGREFTSTNEAGILPPHGKTEEDDEKGNFNCPCSEFYGDIVS